MRSPNPGNANNVRNVNTSGALNNNNAYNGNGAAADCGDSELKVIGQRPTKSKRHTQGGAGLLLRKGGSEPETQDDLREAGRTAISSGPETWTSLIV